MSYGFGYGFFAMKTISITATAEQAIKLVLLLDLELHDLAVAAERAGAEKDSLTQNECVRLFRQARELREQIVTKGSRSSVGDIHRSRSVQSH